MKKILLLLLVNFFLLTGLTKEVMAISDPLSVQNNKYGIHLADHNDIPDAATLVNSSGGDWGYITLVIQENDRDPGKWQNLFNQMRRLHLIPILRLATTPVKDYWQKPKLEDASIWAEFLNNLNWPIENRYVVVFNEPNHAKEWGNNLNPEEYAEILSAYAKAFKEKSADFFLLPAGLDASAPNSGETMEESLFLRRMQQTKPEIFSLLDGWTSHSYPNPNFSGSPFSRGKGTLTSYQWELALLSSLGVNKQLPVFITETGWQHQYGAVWQANLLSPNAVGLNLLTAANIWSDRSIVAITPFVFNYQSPPFDHFSWRVFGNGEYYAHYFAYQNLAKIAGIPAQRLNFSLKQPVLPAQLVADSNYSLTAEITNQGQGILNPREYELKIDSEAVLDYFNQPLPNLEPGEKELITVHLKTKPQPGNYPARLWLEYAGKQITLEETKLSLIPPPSIEASIKLGWKNKPEAKNVTALIYEQDRLLQKFTDLRVKEGRLTIDNLKDIVPQQPYRVVILIPSYLPRQIITRLNTDINRLMIKRFLPFDFNRDGTWNLLDFIAAFRQPPRTIWKLFF